MKALILAGGKGTRLRPLTYTLAKQLVPVACKPILYYVLEQIREAGITDVGIVVSPDNGPSIREALSDTSRWGVQPTFILQGEPGGLAHAVQTAQDYLIDSHFLMFLGDVLVQENIKDVKDKFTVDSCDSLVVLKEVDDPRAFGVAEINESGEILRLVEKPKEPVSNLALAGVYFFTPEIHKAISQIEPSWRNELEITDAIQKLVDMGKTVKGHILKGHWLDTGKKDDLLEANRVILEEMTGPDIQGIIDASSKIARTVKIGTGTTIENSIIKGPASISENCRITGSYIGSYTSISAGTVIERSSIENSVIMEDCFISRVANITESVIGRRVRVISSERKSRQTRLFVGDDSIIEM